MGWVGVDLWQNFPVPRLVQRTLLATVSSLTSSPYLLDPFPLSTDPRAINHALTHSDEFEKPGNDKVAPELLGEDTHSVGVLSKANLVHTRCQVSSSLRVKSTASKYVQ